MHFVVSILLRIFQTSMTCLMVAPVLTDSTRTEERRNGGTEERRNGGMEERRKGGKEERKKGRCSPGDSDELVSPHPA